MASAAAPVAVAPMTSEVTTTSSSKKQQQAVATLIEPIKTEVCGFWDLKKIHVSGTVLKTPLTQKSPTHAYTS